MLTTATGAFHPGFRNWVLFILLPVLICLFNTTDIHARTSSPRLSVDNNFATAGYYRLNWDSEAKTFDLQESATKDFQNTTTLYNGPDRATVISGKPDGTWYYRVRTSVNDRPGAWSKTVTVTVAHHSLVRALLFLSLGCVVFISLVLMIVRANKGKS